MVKNSIGVLMQFFFFFLSLIVTFKVGTQVPTWMKFYHFSSFLPGIISGDTHLNILYNIGSVL